MICSLCEHAQEFGIECEVCGKTMGGLDGLGPPPAMAQLLDGLEPTLVDRVGAVSIEAVGDLEVTAYAPVTAVSETVPDVEPTRTAAVGEVSVERVELSVDRVPDDGQRTQLATGAQTCRYCRHVQSEGALCDRCGMKFPPVRLEAGVVGTIKTRESLKTRCRKCGAPAVGGQRCGDCGHEVPYPEP
jgi:hypothetical protein